MDKYEKHIVKICQNYFLREIPTMTFYLTYIQTFSQAFYLTFYVTSGVRSGSAH